MVYMWVICKSGAYPVLGNEPIYWSRDRTWVTGSEARVYTDAERRSIALEVPANSEWHRIILRPAPVSEDDPEWIL